MIIGKLNHRLGVYIIEQGESDGLGGQLGSRWEKLTETWADVKQVKSTRNYNVGQLSYDMAYEIVIRSRKVKGVADFNPKDFDGLDFATVLYTGRFNENYSVLHEGRHIILHSVVERDDRYYKIFGYYRQT